MLSLHASALPLANKQLMSFYFNVIQKKEEYFTPPLVLVYLIIS